MAAWPAGTRTHLSTVSRHGYGGVLLRALLFLAAFAAAATAFALIGGSPLGLPHAAGMTPCQFAPADASAEQELVAKLCRVGYETA